MNCTESVIHLILKSRIQQAPSWSESLRYTLDVLRNSEVRIRRDLVGTRELVARLPMVPEADS